MKRKPQIRNGEDPQQFAVRLKEWMRDNNAALYAVQQAKRGGELTDDEIDRNIEAFRKQIADDPLPPASEAPSAPSYAFTHLDKPQSLQTPEEVALSRAERTDNALLALTQRVIELEKLVAASVAYRSLSPAAKSRVDKIDPSVGKTFRDKRTLEALAVYDHVVNMGRKKKVSANFPRPLLDSIDLTGGDRPQDDETCRVIPYTALLHRLAAKKAFRASETEKSAQMNAQIAIEKSGLIVTSMHEAGIINGSTLMLVMDRIEAEKRGVVRKIKDVELPKVAAAPEILPRASFDKSAWQDEPEPVANDEDLDIIPASLVVLEPEPTTADAVDDEEIDTETEWEEEEDDGYNEDPIALFRESGEQQKSSKAIDLFAE
jgi:hypothetical protein